MAKIYTSDIERIADAYEKNEDWRALIKSFPYDLQDSVEDAVIREVNYRTRGARASFEEINYWDSLTIEERASRYKRGILGGVEEDLWKADEAKLTKEEKQLLYERIEKINKKKREEWAREHSIREAEARIRMTATVRYRIPALIAVIAGVLYTFYLIWNPSSVLSGRPFSQTFFTMGLAGMLIFGLLWLIIWDDSDCRLHSSMNVYCYAASSLVTTYLAYEVICVYAINNYNSSAYCGPCWYSLCMIGTIFFGGLIGLLLGGEHDLDVIRPKWLVPLVAELPTILSFYYVLYC